MLATLIPYFDKDMKVSAYALVSQRENSLLNPPIFGTSSPNGLAEIGGVEVVHNIGIDTLSPGTDVLIPVTHIAVFSDLESKCEEFRGRLVLVFDDQVENNDAYRNRFTQLKEKGYKLAISKLPVSRYEECKELLMLMDYVILDQKEVDLTKIKIYFRRQYPQIKICVGNIDSQDIFDSLKDDDNFHWFEGKFYRIPITKGETEVSPLKINYLELMNIVNAPDFELTEAADVIGRDTALVVDLLKMVNHIAVNSQVTSIRHAAAILGQRELKKWINTVITKELCADRPNEVSRTSMLRAKFMECLAPVFGLGMKSSEVFLMGLFSILNIILNMPMEEALKMVTVSKEIEEALVRGTGELANIYSFVVSYEAADWQEISRQLIVLNVDTDVIYQAYTETVCWYKEMFFETE
ncbi:MAG: HDOD domain-containing protein [Lachnospiraceae bacterium]|nr:HDOD domain-containing protein [Lachnospiraceae bacterium]